MEAVAVVRQAATAARPELAPVGARLGAPGRSFLQGDGSGPVRAMVAVGAGVRRVRSIRAVVRSQVVGGVEKKTAGERKNSVERTSQLFVGLPLEVVSDCNTLSNTKAIAAGLRPLKLLGVDGVDIPIWWGVVEKESMGQYNWTSYLALVEMVRAAGLKARVSLLFHASKTPAIELPSWVSAIGDSDPDIYFADREGKRQKECLSLAVDELPVLNGKTPVQVVEDFCRSFHSAFSEHLGTTIKDVSIGLGPGGELRYSSVPSDRKRPFSGVGEFQCYDKNMLKQLQEDATKAGNHFWGLSGPHDAPKYEQTPDSGNFFKESGGSWENPYGEFFLSWYSSQLLAHGERMLSMASRVFGDLPVTISAKVPLMHPWSKTRSHPSELTAGFYNTEHRNGYDAVAEMFARNSCRMVVPGMELLDKAQPRTLRSSPESLLARIRGACKKHGVRFCGENYAVSGAADAFAKIKENMLNEESPVESFTYQRMGAYFFSPQHWPHFVEFIRGMDRLKLDVDDQPGNGEPMSLNNRAVRQLPGDAGNSLKGFDKFHTVNISYSLALS